MFGQKSKKPGSRTKSPGAGGSKPADPSPTTTQGLTTFIPSLGYGYGTGQPALEAPQLFIPFGTANNRPPLKGV